VRIHHLVTDLVQVLPPVPSAVAKEPAALKAPPARPSG
jgi:hypothetical protein